MLECEFIHELEKWVVEETPRGARVNSRQIRGLAKLVHSRFLSLETRLEYLERRDDERG